MAVFDAEFSRAVRDHVWLVVAGGVLGVCVLSATALLSRVGPALALDVAIGLTGGAGLVAGVWAGIGFRARREDVIPARWRMAAVSVAAAGVIASVLEWWGLARIQPGVPGRAVTILFLVGLPAYAIGFLLPALLGTDGDEWEDEPENPAVAVAWLAGGLALGMGVAGHFLSVGVSAGPIVLIASTALIFPTFFTHGPASGVEERLIEQRETPYGTLRVVEVVVPGRGQPERRLLLDGEEQAGERVRSGAPTLPYVVALERWLKQVAGPGQCYLFLGGGAYTLPRRISEWDPQAGIRVVERDPAITRLAERAFSLRPEHGIRSVHGDARAVLEVGFPEPFDHVVMDVYDGRQLLPAGLITREAFTRIREALTPDGTFAMNVIGVPAGEGALRFWSTVRTLEDVFPQVALYPHLGPEAPDPQNVLVVAAVDAREWPEQAGSFRLWPEEEWSPARGAVVFHDRVEEDASPVLPGSPPARSQS